MNVKDQKTGCEIPTSGANTDGWTYSVLKELSHNHSFGSGASCKYPQGT